MYHVMIIILSYYNYELCTTLHSYPEYEGQNLACPLSHDHEGVTWYLRGWIAWSQ